MKQPRLVLVTRRFWPLVGEAETQMANLATEFHTRGVQVTLLTAHWERRWPRQIVHRGVNVIRLPQSTVRFWGTLRYLRALSNWLTKHRQEYDLVYVSMLKHDAYAAVGVGQRLKFPVVLRAESAGHEGDCFWQLDARFGRRIKHRCYEASALVGSSPAVVRELIAAGYPRERIQFLPHGIPPQPARTATARQAAREALAQSNSALYLPSDATLTICAQPADERTLDDVITCWGQVDAQCPRARLWIVGNSSLQGELHRRINDLGLSGRVVPVGTFDDWTELLAAADIFVQFGNSDTQSVTTLTAMAAGLPCVVSDPPMGQTLIKHEENGLLAAAGVHTQMAAFIVELVNQPQRQAQLGQAARQLVETQFSLQQSAARHLELFEKLCGQAHRSLQVEPHGQAERGRA